MNACEEVSLFSEILCDRTLLGEAIPANMIVLAACNPYQLRKDNREKVRLPLAAFFYVCIESNEDLD